LSLRVAAAARPHSEIVVVPGGCSGELALAGRIRYPVLLAPFDVVVAVDW